MLFYGLFYGLKTYKYDGYTSSVLTQAQKDEMEFADMDDEDEIKQDCEPPLLPTLLGQTKRWKEHNCNQ
ncbi:hypothetical protein MNB_ARC-1_1120 [hydrothermal vent metagenome]|uniref:Uncharacterized protein n=1 Tax=hydrothermal vent metagenome TaxID=652676 RepID=A0A3B1E949_9ZZZZ